MAYPKAEAREKLTGFLGRYKRHEQEGKLSKLKEENTKDYLDELFRILGWDIIDDVIKEYGTGKKKRVDYAFHIKGTTKFLLEAKAYGEDIQEKHIAQALQYGYLNNKTWVVLTNLREIRIYNAKYFDKEEQIRQLFSPIRLDHALERFDDLWLISREAMAQGLINEVASKYGKVRPREAIDKKIFEDLMEWRSLLTKNISKNNTFEGTMEERGDKIDEAVQKMLDRIIFTRVCEDRGLEEEGMLKWCITQSKEEGKYALSRYLNRQFSRLNGVYNSGLFAPHFSEELNVDDAVLERIIEETYRSPDGLRYDFSAIDADILGTVYEQYLGTLLKKTEKRATLKSKKSQRKKMGIYYTPVYIVEYIVKNTLGERLKECKTPEEALKIRVLDPACGSGSFLIRAYDEFKHWFETYKAKRGDGGEQTILSSEGKKGLQTFMDRVLEECIYGVDLDPKAVELAQLNLLLKAAEDRHKLPKLDHTIQNGNSLIDDQTIVGSDAFNWREKLPEVFQSGGFDVVIGNPPYEVLAAKEREGEEKQTEAEVAYFRAKYQTHKGKLNLYKLMLERALSLLNPKSKLGFIIPSTIISDQNTSEMRKRLIDGSQDLHIIEFPESARVFQDVTQGVCIVLIGKGANRRDSITLSMGVMNEEELAKAKKYKIKISDIKKIDPKNMSIPRVSSTELGLLNRLSTYGKLAEQKGLGVFQGEVNLTVYKDCILTNGTTRLIRGDQIKRYVLRETNKPSFLDKECFLRKVGDGKKAKHHQFERIALQEVSNMQLKRRLNATIIPPGRFLGHTCNYILSENKDLMYLILGLFNSKLLNWRFKITSTTNHVSGREVGQLPIPDGMQIKRKKLVDLVKRMLELNDAISKEPNESSDKVRRLKSEVEKTDAEIDNLICDIYALTKDEQKIIEEST